MVKFIERMKTFLCQELSNHEESESKKSKWESLKLKIAEFTKKYSVAKASDRSLIISQLSEKVTELEDIYHTLTDEQMLNLEQSKIELDDLMLEKARGVMFRSRAQWMCEAERT